MLLYPEFAPYRFGAQLNSDGTTNDRRRSVCLPVGSMDEMLAPHVDHTYDNLQISETTIAEYAKDAENAVHAGLYPKIYFQTSNKYIWLEPSQKRVLRGMRLLVPDSLQVEWGEQVQSSEQIAFSTPKTLNVQRAPGAKTLLPVVLAQTELNLDGRISKKVHHAIADSGSTENVMSEAFARSQRLTIKKSSETPAQFINAQGGIFGSIGQVSAQCSFPGEPGKTWVTEFSVVPSLTVPLVLGQRFLDLTETLTRFRSRLKKITRGILGHAKLLHMDVPRRRFPVSLNGYSVLANADTGSDLDLMSAECARKYGLIKTKLHKREKHIKLADGTVVKLQGKVRTNLQVQDGIIPGHTFYVMKNLSSDVLLGGNTLEAFRVFEDHAGSFVEMPGDGSEYGMNLITWRGIFRKKSPVADFETQLEAEDNKEAARQETSDKRLDGMNAADRLTEEQREAELRRKYNERRKEMVRIQKIVLGV